MPPLFALGGCMLSKKTKRLLSALLLGVAFFVGVFINHSKQAPQVPHQIVQEQRQEIDYSEAIVTQLESINKLEIYQAYLKNTITIHQGYNNRFFRNDKTINIPATGIYKLDLDNVTGNIIIGQKVVTIIAHLEYDVIVHEDKMEFTDNKGYLAFYDIKLEPEETAAMIAEAKKQMLNKMQDQEYLDIVQRKAEKVIAEQLDGLDYNIRVLWR